MKKLLFTAFLGLFSLLLHAQSTEILPGAVLPQMTSEQRNAPGTTFTEGMLVFDTTVKKYFFRRGTDWVELGSGNASAWGLNGNHITSGDFIGTTNAEHLVFKVNGDIMGRINTRVHGNIIWGYQALEANVSGYSNFASGSQALRFNVHGSNNTAIGTYALGKNTNGGHNIANGLFALLENKTGNHNIAKGEEAMYNNIDGSNNIGIGTKVLHENNSNNNIAIGNQTMYSNTTGGRNIASGYRALYSNKTGSNNIGIGTEALYNNTESYNIGIGYKALLENTTGPRNTALGFLTLQKNKTGAWNTAIGNSALNLATGSRNTSIGGNSMAQLSSGDQNTAVGVDALKSLTSGSNNIAIGYNAQVFNSTESNQVRIGNGAIGRADINVAWNSTSDKRLKKDIQTTPLGLSLVNQLNPVSYVRKNDENQRTEYGFIAQEVEKLLKSAGVPTDGIVGIDDSGTYSLRYNDFIAISVKAIQELSEEVTALRAKKGDLKDKISSQNEQIRVQDERLSRLEALFTSLNTAMDED